MDIDTKLIHQTKLSIYEKIGKLMVKCRPFWIMGPILLNNYYQSTKMIFLLNSLTEKTLV